MKIIGIVILLIFYSIYLGKMALQKRKGIQTNQIAKGKKKDKVFYIETILKIATYSVVLVEVISIYKFDRAGLASVGFKSFDTFSIAGAIIGFIGDGVFAMAVLTMKDSWRAGLAKGDETKIVTNGIYKISRNPAFLGFDCVYLGILLMFFNWVLLVFSAFAIIMLHLQILQEEQYLPDVFGEEYISYKEKVCRYIGRKRRHSSYGK